MIAFVAELPAAATALLAAIAAGGLWLTARVYTRWERRKLLLSRHNEPCRRCGARN